MAEKTPIRGILTLGRFTAEKTETTETTEEITAQSINFN
jgi:hypothetical protein